MDEKVPELLDLTKRLLDQSVEIVDDSLPSVESVAAKKVRYSIFLRVQMSEVYCLRFFGPLPKPRLCTATVNSGHSLNQDCAIL